jgi:hypothetical protein
LGLGSSPRIQSFSTSSPSGSSIPPTVLRAGLSPRVGPSKRIT